MLASAQPIWHPERVAHGAPDGLDVLAVGEGLVHSAVAESGDDMVLSHALGIAIAELRPHPLPERR